MASVRIRQEFDSPADTMWERIGDFGKLDAWHPAVAECATSDAGQVRTLSLEGGGTIVETLEAGEPRSYTYRIDESPLPVADYHATIRVIEAGDGSVVEWDADFTPAGASEAEAVETIEGIFRSGLDAL